MVTKGHIHTLKPAAFSTTFVTTWYKEKQAVKDERYSEKIDVLEIRMML